MRSEKDNILESFGDRRTVIVVGLLCCAYFVLYFFYPGVLGKILPAWNYRIFLAGALAVLLYQIYVWKKLEHFKRKWFKHGIVWLLFFCEFHLILFTVAFLSWPVYLIYNLFANPKL